MAKLKQYPTSIKYMVSYYQGLEIFHRKEVINILLILHNSKNPANLSACYKLKYCSRPTYSKICRTLVKHNIMTEKGNKFYATNEQRILIAKIINLCWTLGLNSTDKHD